MSIKQLAEQIQKDCHKEVNSVITSNPGITIQAATNVFIYQKLSELQLKIEELSDRIGDGDSYNP